MRRALSLAGAAVACSWAAAAPLGAAALGSVLSASLGAWTITGGSGAPVVVTWDDFTAPSGTNLNGRALPGGGAWVAGPGTWTVQADRARASSTSNAALEVAAGSPDRAVEARLAIGSGPNAGLTLCSDGTTRLIVTYSRTSGGRIQLHKLAPGSTLLATVTGVGTPSTMTLRADATTSTVRITKDGVVVLSYTLTAAELAAFKTATHTRFGLRASFDAQTRFDDFHVDA